MKEFLRRARWLVTLTVVNVSCGTLQVPPTPPGKFCTIDLPRDRLICFPFGGIRLKKKDTLDGLKKNVESSTSPVMVPLDEADKYVAFDPDSWSGLSLYIETMKEIIRAQCR